MSYTVSRELRRAYLIACWSYIGIIMPVTGIILGGISRSIAADQEDSYQQTRTKNLAAGGIVVSIVSLLLGVLITIFSVAYLNSQEVEPIPEATNNSTTLNTPVGPTRQESIAECQGRVDDAISTAHPGKVSYEEAQIILTIRQQNYDMCVQQAPNP